MFNLDLSKSLAVQQLMQQAALAEEQKLLLKALNGLFGQVPKQLSNRIRTITQSDVLDQLFQQAFRCQDLDSFKQKIPKKLNPVIFQNPQLPKYL